MQILGVEAALWRCVAHPEVEPTNHRAERALRPFVIWRKLSFQTQTQTQTQTQRGDRCQQPDMSSPPT